MGKAIKLKNNLYIDKSSIHFEDSNSVNMNGYKGYWCRITSHVFTVQYTRFCGRVLIENGGYEPAMADIWFSYYAQNALSSSSPFVSQTKILNATGYFSLSNQVAITVEGKGTNSVIVSLWVYEPYDYSILNIFKMYNTFDIKNCVKAKTLPGEITYLT